MGYVWSGLREAANVPGAFRGAGEGSLKTRKKGGAVWRDRCMY